MQRLKASFMETLEQLRLIPEVKRGSTRKVYVFRERGFAVKVPVFLVRRFWRELMQYRKSWWELKFFFTWSKNFEVRNAYFYLLKGLSDNLMEWIFYLRHSDEQFLFPTVFSLFGLMNITPLGEELPDGDGLWPYAQEAIGLGCESDQHHFGENANFCCYNGLVRIRDYGSGKTQGIINNHGPKLRRLPVKLIMEIKPSS